MKSLSWAVLGLLLCVPFAGAEVIDSVSFNPARLGRYETLKVSDQLTTKGGIEANAVTVQSGGTVSVNNTGNYKFPVTEVLGSVDMKSTDFEAGTLNSRGTASFENKSGSAESKISTLNTSTADVRANILDLTSVTVPTGGSFTLGENAIPEPWAGVQQFDMGRAYGGRQLQVQGTGVCFVRGRRCRRRLHRKSKPGAMLYR